MYVLCTQFPNTVPSSAQDWSCKWSFVFLLSLPVCLPTTADIIGPWICSAISREHKLWKWYFCFWFFTFWRCRETSRSARNSVYKRDHNLIKNRQLKVSLQYIVYRSLRHNSIMIYIDDKTSKRQILWSFLFNIKLHVIPQTTNSLFLSCY